MEGAEHLGPKAAEEYVNEAIMREAVAIQMTWVGAPTIYYYGDEAGVCGFRSGYQADISLGNENQELLNFHKEMIRIHKEHPALRTGSLNILSWDENVLAYGRFWVRTVL